MDIVQRLKDATNAAVKGGATRYRISKDSGVKYATLVSFLDKGSDLKLSNAAKLATLLDLDLLPRKRTK